MIAAQSLPDLTGMSEPDALREIERAGFSFHSQTAGGYRQFRHPDDSVVWIRPDGEIVRTGPRQVSSASSSGKKFRPRYDQLGDRTEQHRTGETLATKRNPRPPAAVDLVGGWGIPSEKRFSGRATGDGRMPKLAKFRRRHAKTNPAPKRNPPIATDIFEYIVPGFAAFAASRFITRVAAVQIAKRWPRYAKHAGALAAVGTFGATWYGGHHVKQLERYHHPIVVGSGLAALQSLIQIYLPAIGWMVADPCPELAAPPATNAVARGIEEQPVPAGFAETDANTWFSYNDAYDAGAYKGATAAPPPARMPAVPPSEPDEMQIDDLLDNDMGSFS